MLSPSDAGRSAADLMSSLKEDSKTKEDFMQAFLSRVDELDKNNLDLLQNLLTSMKKPRKKKGRKKTSALNGVNASNGSSSIMNLPFSFNGRIPSSTAIVAIDCEGLMLRNGKENVASSVVLVGGDDVTSLHKDNQNEGSVIFSAFVHYPDEDILDTKEGATGITKQMIKDSPLTAEYIKWFLLQVLLKNRPTIIGWNIESDWKMLGVKQDIRQHYGIDFCEKVIDLQSLMRRQDGSKIALPIIVQEFSNELSSAETSLRRDKHQAVIDARATLLMYTKVFLRRDIITDYSFRVRNCRKPTPEERKEKAKMFSFKQPSNSAQTNDHSLSNGHESSVKTTKTPKNNKSSFSRKQGKEDKAIQ